ncbi:DUF1611 domain-containing protein, partial [Vibrio sp. 10N.261.55.F4]
MSISTQKLRNIFKLTRIENVEINNDVPHFAPWLPLAQKVKPVIPSA